MALSSTFCTGSDADCGANWSTAMASTACLPRIRSTMRRAFWGVTRTCRALALASITLSLFSVGAAISDDAPSCRPSRDP